jgi:hypothetical protein
VSQAPGVDRDPRTARYRLVPQMSVYDHNEQYLRPYVTFAAQPNKRSAVLNTDGEGFRISASPAGPVDAGSWLAGGGGGLVLGGSWAFGVGATCDAATLPSHLACLSGTPQLNLGICTGNTLQFLIGAIPFLDAARTIVVCNGMGTVLTAVQTLGLNEIFGPIRFESLLAGLGTAPIARVVEQALTGVVDGAPRLRVPRRSPAIAGAGPDRLEALIEAALRRQVRDLRILCRARPGHTRVLFCHQPVCDPGSRDLSPEERELHDIDAVRRMVGRGLREAVRARWESYGRRLAAECSALSVRFLDLPAHRFGGWSFVDEFHMTDDGYRQAAELVWEALR